LKNEGNGPVAADAVMILREGTVPEAGPLAHNAAFPQDVNDDGRVSTGDVLSVVNSLLRTAAPLTAMSQIPSRQYYVDVTGDGRVSTSDVLMVVNYLLRHAAAPQTVAEPAAAVDESLVLFDDTGDAPAATVAPRVAGGIASQETRVLVQPDANLLTPVAIEACFAEEQADDDLVDLTADLGLDN
jgi:hypothetical protein